VPRGGQPQRAARPAQEAPQPRLRESLNVGPVPGRRRGGVV
jgi:hypothetical protein